MCWRREVASLWRGDRQLRRSADIPVRGNTGLSSPVFPSVRATRPRELATGKSPEPADRNVRATPRFPVPPRDCAIVATFHEPERRLAAGFGRRGVAKPVTDRRSAPSVHGKPPSPIGMHCDHEPLGRSADLRIGKFRRVQQLAETVLGAPVHGEARQSSMVTARQLWELGWSQPAPPGRKAAAGAFHC